MDRLRVCFPSAWVASLLAVLLPAYSVRLKPSTGRPVLDVLERDDPCWLLLMPSPQKREILNGRVPCSVLSARDGRYNITLTPRPGSHGELGEVPGASLKLVRVNEEYVEAVKNFTQHPDVAMLGYELAVADQARRMWLFAVNETNMTEEEHKDLNRKATAMSIMARKRWADEVRAKQAAEEHAAQNQLTAREKELASRKTQREEQVASLKERLVNVTGFKHRMELEAVLQSLKTSQEMEDAEALQEREEAVKTAVLNAALQPGVFKVRIDHTRLAKSDRLGAAVLQGLEKDSLVHVVHIENRPEEDTVQGFVEKPMGWMPILQKSNRLVFAERLKNPPKEPSP